MHLETTGCPAVRTACRMVYISSVIALSAGGLINQRYGICNRISKMTASGMPRFGFHPNIRHERSLCQYEAPFARLCLRPQWPTTTGSAIVSSSSLENGDSNGGKHRTIGDMLMNCHRQKSVSIIYMLLLRFASTKGFKKVVGGLLSVVVHSPFAGMYSCSWLCSIALGRELPGKCVRVCLSVL